MWGDRGWSDRHREQEWEWEECMESLQGSYEEAAEMAEMRAWDVALAEMAELAELEAQAERVAQAEMERVPTCPEPPQLGLTGEGETGYNGDVPTKVSPMTLRMLSKRQVYLSFLTYYYLTVEDPITIRYLGGDERKVPMAEAAGYILSPDKSLDSKVPDEEWISMATALYSRIGSLIVTLGGAEGFPGCPRSQWPTDIEKPPRVATFLDFAMPQPVPEG